MNISTGKNISFFEKGDIITRVIPAIIHREEETDIMGNIKVDLREDYSYRGDPLEYVGIANNMIYLKRYSDLDKKVFGNSLIDLDIQRWSDGWDIYIDPEELSK